MSGRLLEKVAIVTGASKGIGAAIAVQMAAEGASVVVNYNSSLKEADRVVDQIVGSGGRAVAIQADMGKEADVRRLFAESNKAFGRLDILVNNAGLYAYVPLADLTAEYCRRMFEVNLLGVLLACQEAARHFGADGGSIVNISSIAATTRAPNVAMYSATKGGVEAMTRVLAIELAGRKIRVNSIAPGPVITEGYLEGGHLDSDVGKYIQVAIPLGRMGMPNDIAPAAVFLASDESSWLTGENIAVSGGMR